MSQIHPQIQAILDRARQRAADNNLPYAGALTPPEAQQVLLGMPEAKLVDVRTQPSGNLWARCPMPCCWNGSVFRA